LANPSCSWVQPAPGRCGTAVLALLIVSFTLDGETFNGLTVYQEVNGDEIALLPKLDKQKMFRGVLGYRYERAALDRATGISDKRYAAPAFP
jgi:hypothetical protein